MNLVSTLQTATARAVQALFDHSPEPADIQVQSTSSDFQGDFTIVVFPFVKFSKKSPEQTAGMIGEFLQREVDDIAGYNVIKGFLNLELSESYWQNFLAGVLSNPTFGQQPPNGRKVLVEYSSPNTNKPLHLGHVRNCLLGWSCSRLLETVGYSVGRVQIINDRGVAICKSMLSWLKYGNGQTPESTGTKGDHFVGDYYVLFEKKSREEYETWQLTDEAQSVFAQKGKDGQDQKDFFKAYKNHWFNTHSRMGAEVRDMLLKWEAGDEETLALWRKLNGWVYDGFDKTYAALGVDFDKLYYESDTYLLGKDIVDEGLQKGVFYKKEDGSVWVDLTDAGHDEKVVLRADGTSVYITQDMGTARMRYNDFGCDSMVYVVADEQNYHFAVLFETLKRLGEPYADGLHHLSYGLVELPSGRMKTREGNVVDADDLIGEVVRLAAEQAAERGAQPDGQQENLRKVAMGALKFFIIKVHPKKKMIFNPEESLDFQGQTGPYIQYSYVRINGLMQKAEKESVNYSASANYTGFAAQEKELLKLLHQYPDVIQQAAADFDPSHLAVFCYNLAKSYHRLWHDLSIFQAESPAAMAFRLSLSRATGQVLRHGMDLLGIQMPDRM